MQFDSTFESLFYNRRQFLRGAAAIAAGGVAFMAGSAPADALTINPRSSWATNRPAKGPLSGEDVKFLLVHHSASRNGHSGSDAPDILRAFYDFHTGPKKGWNDIAYNFLIDADGGIWEGRTGSLNGPVAGDATGGNQGFGQLVCLIGDFNTANPSNASKQSLALLLGWLADRYSIDTSTGASVSFVSRGSNKWPSGVSVTTPTITGHRTMSQTTCPGNNLYSYVTGGLFDDVNAIRGGSATSPTASVPPSSPSSTAPPTAVSSPSTTAAPTTSSLDLTTTSADPIPSVSPGVVASSSTTTSTPGTTLTSATTTSSSAVPLAAESFTPTRSPLMWTGLGIAGLASALLVWRNKRMGG